MKILVIGSGGREHAICRAFQKSSKVKKIICADGNAGIGKIADCIAIKPHEISRLADFAAENKVDLTFVGGETSLALGIVDEFEKRELKIFGVSQKAARLEASKSFAKDFMKRHLIPTAQYRISSNISQAKGTIESGFFGDENSPVVIKADGLAGGKGVVVAENRAEAFQALDELENVAGASAIEKIVLEECLFGREVSLLAFVDGENFALMPPVRDHKRIGEGDVGANTGGMGTVSDASLLNEIETARIIREIIEPTVKGCLAEGFPFRGILFLGLMMTLSGPKLLEYNVRFGDPETQVILARLKTDLVDICEAGLSGSLDGLSIEWHQGSSACVVLASRGYPQKAQTGDIIYGLDLAEKHEKIEIFHAGTGLDEKGHFVSAGGRVLGVTGTGDNLAEALDRVYQAVNDISWNGMQYRRDIGK